MPALATDIMKNPSAPKVFSSKFSEKNYLKICLLITVAIALLIKYKMPVICTCTRYICMCDKAGKKLSTKL
jgi:hypothetical protein